MNCVCYWIALLLLSAECIIASSVLVTGSLLQGAFKPPKGGGRGVQSHHPHSWCLQEGLGSELGSEGPNFALTMLGMRQRACCASGDGGCGEAVGATTPGCAPRMLWAEGTCSLLWSPPCSGLPSPAAAFFSDTSSCFSQGLLPSPPSLCLARFLFPSLSAV